MEQKAQDSQLREQKLSTELNSATSRLRQIEMNILKQEPMENYKAKVR